MGGEKTLPIMPFYVRDHITGTRGMSLAERGAYFDLLCFEWDTGPLPKDPARLASMVGCAPRVFAALWATVKQKFTEMPEGYVSRRLESERQVALEKRAKASDKAAAASAARWQRTFGDAVTNASSTARRNAPSIPQAFHEQCPPSPSPSPSPYIKPPEETAPRKRARPAMPDGTRARPGAAGIDESDPEVQRRRRLAREAVAEEARTSTEGVGSG